MLKFKLGMSTLKNIQTASQNSLPFKSYCQNNDEMSLLHTFSKRLSLMGN